MRVDNFRIADKIAGRVMKLHHLRPYDIRVSQFQIRYALDPSDYRGEPGKREMSALMGDCAKQIDKEIFSRGLRITFNDSEESPWIAIYDFPTGVESDS